MEKCGTDYVAWSLVITTILSINWVSGTAAEFAGGTGESDDPYQIATAEQLASIGGDSALLSKHFILVADIDMNPALEGGRVFDRAVIAPDSDGTDSRFQGAKFRGSFNGNAHIIANLTIRSGGGACDHLGLFGCIDNARNVYNLGLIDASVEGGDEARYVGALAGQNSGFITACYADAAVQGYYYIGVLVGYNEFNGVLFDCYTRGAAFGTTSMGGLVGNNAGWLVRCYSASFAEGGSRFGGGLAAENTGVIVQSYFLSPDDGGGSDNGYGIVLSSADMRKESSFAGWSFYSDGLDRPEGQGCNREERTSEMRNVIVMTLVSMLGVCGCAVHDSTPSMDATEPNRGIPAQIASFHPISHFAPVDQGSTSACWSFATLSFVETEAARLGMPAAKLAVMYPMYYAFVEKAKYFVQTKGESRCSPGDLFPTVFEVIQKYGIVPDENYSGRPDGAKTYNHDAMYKELRAYTARVKEENLWDEAAVVAEVKSILNKHLGEPPARFDYNGRSYTPKSFQREFVALPWQDYLLVTSFEYAPFHTFTELRVPDNWRHNSRYYNVPLDVFYESLKGALRAGYSAAFDSDISEPGRLGAEDIAIVPAYDIPPQFITQKARQYRFDKELTTDDHLMHMVGVTQSGGYDWFLVKDSWRDAWQGQHKGYFFYRGDFVKLKVLAYLVHKDAVPMLRAD